MKQPPEARPSVGGRESSVGGRQSSVDGPLSAGDGPLSAGEALRLATSALEGGGEKRPGQLALAEAVERAVREGRHLIAQAGTGTGKSLAYLVPLLLSGRKVVVATATKALQDQLASKDLPFLAGLDGLSGRRFAVLKGRANYVCRQRVAEVTGQTAGFAQGSDQTDGAVQASTPEPALFDRSADSGQDPAPGGRDLLGDTSDGLAWQMRRIIAWSEITTSGDRADLGFEPAGRAWSALSMPSRECPGVHRCPSGATCFAELARQRAHAADVVLVNTHLYATDVASGGEVLPEHQVVVFDEAHQVEDVMTSALGIEVTPGRLRALAQACRSVVLQGERNVCDALADAASSFEEVIVPRAGSRVLTSRHDPLTEVLGKTRARVESLISALRSAQRDDTASEREARRTRALNAAGHLHDDLERLTVLDDDEVAWIEGSTLKTAPVEVGSTLAARLWPEVTGVLTSATVPPGTCERLGLPVDDTDQIDVGSEFPYESTSLLYCAAHLPDPRRPDAGAKLQQELAELISAAGGRTLGLFTSWRAMNAAVSALRPMLPFKILAQNDLPKRDLLRQFTEEEQACLFATMSFWQGVDVPGPTLSLVAVDRLPFARPDDPLSQAKRERAGAAAFNLVDLPRASTLLAQGAGRLVRRIEDRGVVAVLDPRLATAGYGATLRQALPPMPFTTDRCRALSFLAHISRERAGSV